VTSEDREKREQPLTAADIERLRTENAETQRVSKGILAGLDQILARNRDRDAVGEPRPSKPPQAS